MFHELSFFTSKLLQWHKRHNARELPWKGEKDPYKIWLSEIILQQTRAQQGLSYYLKFISLFPTVADLAKANLEEVIFAWEGLGYYSRARNLHFSARYICNNLNGVFPTSYDELIKLKGVGPYTAAAISSFAFNEKRAVLDGNVIRVLSRFLGIETPYDTGKGKKEFQQLADEFLFQEDSATYNQAIMDFGASVCTPKVPLCSNCALSENCVGFNQNKIKELPVKSKKLSLKNRYFLFYVFRYKNSTFIEERHAKDIWQGLNQFPLKELKNWQEMSIQDHIKYDFENIYFEMVELSEVYTQRLTHQKINAKFVVLDINEEISGFKKVETENLSTFAFPKIINLFLERKSLILSKD